VPLRPQKQSLTLSREVTAEKHIPFSAHVDAHTLRTHQGDYVQTFRLEGLAHETVHEDELEVWHEQLALFLRNINSPHLALWSYVIRRASGDYVEGRFAPGFAAEFDGRYRESVGRRRMHVNELFLALVYRPELSATARAAERLDPAMRDKARLLNPAALQRNTAAVERINGFSQEVEKYLRRYGPERLGVYALDRRTGKEYRGEDREQAPDDALLFSESLEFYGYIVNGEHQRMPLLRADVASTLQTSRFSAGRETIELRGAASQVYAAMLAWKEYPDPSFPGQLNELLRAPFEFVLTQSFVLLEKSAARGALKRQYARLESTEDDAVGETEALRDAIEGIASNRFGMGTHNLSMCVKASDVRSLAANISEARRALADSGAVVVREDLGCEPAFWSMLAGNFGDRTRPSDMTSRNFIGFASMHNYPSGRRDGNHWGPALALLKTASGAPYFFSLHRRDVGHFAIFGSTGAGKTVLVMFLITMAQKFGATLIYFDKDRGGEICVRALGGQYFALRRGEPTGFNPFALPPTPHNIGFVQELVRVLVRAETPFLARENTEIDRAVSGVFRLDAANRRLASVVAYLEPPAANNIAARLLRWVHTDRGIGPLAWVFDNPADVLDLTSTALCGFDITHFLDDELTRTPLMMYLFHRLEALKDGRRGGVIIDEGWKALDDVAFEQRIRDSLKTDRKKDWFLGFATQSPKDALKSRIAHTISEQTPTKIFLPNINAREEDYVQGFGCTEGEFQTIRSLSESGRRFVLKQGDNAVVCELDLGGFDDDLAVFSGTAANVALLDRIREEVGDDPNVWLPIFHERRRVK
jgi:type IV secretion system protein VirB4